MADLILETRDLSYEYPGIRHGTFDPTGKRPFALDEVDLEVSRGKKLALLGANGAGKTTLLLQLNGMLRPTRGSVWFDGQAVDYSRKGILRWRQNVGLVFQEPDDQLFAASVQQDVSFGPLNLGLAEPDVRERVDEALDAMGIRALAESPPHMLSFGQKKRAAIAGVLAMKPKVLVLDEPTAGLDPRGVGQLLDTLESLRAAGTTLILSTHNVDLAYSWADEIAVLTDGRMFAQGLPPEVMRDEAEMDAAHLRVPWVLAMTKQLRQNGRTIDPTETPRTFDQLYRYLHPGTDDQSQ